MPARPRPEAVAVTKRVNVEVEGRQLSLSNLDKVLYPEVGFTKAEVIAHYQAVAPVMLPHLAGRPVTLRRFPNGVDAASFFEKRCPKHRPDWLEPVDGPGDKGQVMDYCGLTETAALVWVANLAALELHTTMGRSADLETPTMCVFDLDPGPGTTVVECAQVAQGIREVLDGVGLEAFPKTSGSKGLQLYVPLNTPHTFEHTSSFALAVAQVLEKQRPEEVVTVQERAARKDKVLIDWSQNSRHKTTVCVYSLRARPEPTVSTPVTWEEVDEAADGRVLAFRTEEVLARVADRGDLFAPTLTMEQVLPVPRG